ncbi:unnamed protein product [Ectocarpus sp. CCAP 1310/34]|nr:unnamed protein product [Ectocarpus sp. CCAP 1310/34]
MAVAAIPPPSMPSSKKRCWNLLVKDVRNHAQEDEVLSSFRKRYTSTRKLAFRPVADYAGGSTTTSTPPPLPTDTTTTTITHGGRACIEIQFTGPQPIEGPAGLLCSLLEATFVSAHPVQLDRGRKRKTRPGGGGGSRSSLSSSTPPLAETSEEGCSRSVALKTTAADTASATAGDSPASSSSSSSGGSGGAAGAAMKSGAAAAKHEDLSDYVSDTTSYASSRTSSSSDLLDLLDHDDGSSSSSSSSSSSDATWADVGELPSTSSPFSPNQEQQHADDMVVIDDDICTAFGVAFGGQGGLILGGGGGGGGGGSLSAPVPATTADFPASSTSPPPCLGRSCSVMTAEGNDLPRWDDVIRGVESPPSSGGSIDEADASGDRLPAAAAPPPLGARPASGDTDDPAPASASCPGLARGTSYDECRAGVMSQEEAVSLFAAAGAATAEAKPPASAAAASAGHGQWEGAPDDNPDAPFCPVALERHCSSTWALLDPTNAGAAAAAVTVAGEEGATDHQRASIVPDPCLAAESSEEQQQAIMWYGEGPHHSAVPAGGGLEMPPPGDSIAFGWCEQTEAAVNEGTKFLSYHRVTHAHAPPCSLTIQECDFDGNCAATPSKPPRGLPPTAATSFFPDPSAAVAACTSRPSSNYLNNRCRLAFLGLESELRDVTVCARFSVDPASRVERFASLPLDGAAGGGGGGDPAGVVGGRRGRADAAVEFPSIMEIWPEVYKVDNIRVMEVDMVVEVRSSEGNILYTGPTLKLVGAMLAPGVG